MANFSNQTNQKPPLLFLLHATPPLHRQLRLCPRPGAPDFLPPRRGPATEGKPRGPGTQAQVLLRAEGFVGSRDSAGSEGTGSARMSGR